MKKRIKKSWCKLGYTLRHKKVLLDLEKRFTGKNSLRIYLHDMDKVLAYLFLPYLGVKRISKLHQVMNQHHKYADKRKLKNQRVLEEVILDWESARYTKADKPLSAREFCLENTPELYDTLKPVLDSWGI